MTKTYGLTPEKHSEIESRLRGVCELLEITVEEIGEAYPILSEEYQAGYKAFISTEAFRIRMISAKENKREERGVK